MGGFLSSLGPAIMSGVGGALGGLPGALIGGGVSYLFNSMSQNRQNTLQQRNNRYWADYNSPINQMARLRAAGLNPALVYGHGQVANTFQPQNSVSALPTHVSLEDGLKSAMLFEDLKNRQKSNKLLDKNIQSTDEDIKGKKLDNARKEASNPTLMGQNDLQSIINDNNLKLEDITRKNTENENLRLENGILKTKQQLADLDLELKSTYGRAQEYYKMMNSAAALKFAELQNDTYLERWLVEKKYKFSQMSEIKATISNLHALGSLYNAQKDKTEFESDGLQIKNAILDLERYLKLMSLPADLFDRYVQPVLNIIRPFKSNGSSSDVYNRGRRVTYP